MLLHKYVSFIPSYITFIHLTAGIDYIRFLHFYQHIAYQLLSMLKIKHDFNLQYLKIVALHFVESA